MDPEETFIELVGNKGEAWIAGMLVSACEVSADASESDEEEALWKDLARDAEALRDKIARVHGSHSAT